MYKLHLLLDFIALLVKFATIAHIASIDFTAFIAVIAFLAYFPLEQ